MARLMVLTHWLLRHSLGINVPFVRLENTRVVDSIESTTGRNMMRYRGVISAGFACLAILFLLSAEPAVAAMKVVAATILIPEDDKPTLLAGLEYPGEWTVAFTSVRLERDPKEGADPVRPVWTFVATSTRPMVQKAIVEIHLLDGSGKKIKSIKKFVIIKSITKRQEIPIKMKVKRADWEQAEKVRIKITFTVL